MAIPVTPRNSTSLTDVTQLGLKPCFTPVKSPQSNGISEASITRLIGAVLLEANDEWQLQHRYMQLEAMAELLSPDPEADTLRLPPLAA